MKTFGYLLLVLTLISCGTKPFGKKVKEPFTGNAYESNARFFRGTGKGESSKENIAWSKADMNAKTELAGQVQTNMKQVADQYLVDKANENAAEVMEKFESITRQVMNTTITDLRKTGEKKYYNGEVYTVFIAYEIKKRAMFRFLKKQAEVDAKINDSTRKAIIEILEEEMAKLPEED